MSCLMTKPTKWHVRPAKTQISLGIHPVWSESSPSAWRKLGSWDINWVHSEDSDQTGQMPSLIWVFDGRTVILLVLSWGGSYLFLLPKYCLKNVIFGVLSCNAHRAFIRINMVWLFLLCFKPTCLDRIADFSILSPISICRQHLNHWRSDSRCLKHTTKENIRQELGLVVVVVKNVDSNSSVVPIRVSSLASHHDSQVVLTGHFSVQRIFYYDVTWI